MDSPIIYHQSNLRKGRVSLPGYVYFITKCKHTQFPLVLTDQVIAKIIIEELIAECEKYSCKIGGFVFMSEHLHFSVMLSEKIGLSKFINLFCGSSAHRINQVTGKKGKVWQSGYFDHCLRNLTSFMKHLNYMYENPVRKRLVKTPEEWLYSTAHRNYAYLIDWKYFS